MVTETAAYAREKGLWYSVMIADAPKMPVERLVRLANSVKDYANSISIMDTFGTLSPIGSAAFVDIVQPQIALPIEFHCHNDYGLAGANELAAVTRGVSKVHSSFLGLGERIGNAHTEEMATALEILYGVETGVNLKELCRISQKVSQYSKVPVCSNTPVVGRGVNTIVSGLVATEYARLKAAGEDWEKWLFPFMPYVVGLGEPEMVLSKSSGLTNLNVCLEKAGISLDEESQKKLLEVVKEKAAAEGRLISPSELAEMIKKLG
jgi:isopropylmalate/homocitrate/citramalate synthase